MFNQIFYVATFSNLLPMRLPSDFARSPRQINHEPNLSASDYFILLILNFKRISPFAFLE